ncbi:hypothetical protein PTKIN_Ptkin17bG0098000 [Pterospermum kingtungense]
MISTETLALNSPILPTFFFVFVFFYLFTYLFFRNWRPKDRPVASSCSISLAYGVATLLLTAIAIRKTPHHSFASPNSALQNLVLEYSISYLLVDLFHYLIFLPNHVLFILHHLATLYVFCTCRYMVHHGASALLRLLIAAESTNLCSNLWTLLGLLRADVPVAAQVYELLSHWIYAAYTVNWGVLGSILVCEMVVFDLSGLADNLIPTWAWISWMGLIIIAMLVTIARIYHHWQDWYRERNKRKKVVYIIRSR